MPTKTGRPAKVQLFLGINQRKSFCATIILDGEFHLTLVKSNGENNGHEHDMNFLAKTLKGFGCDYKITNGEILDYHDPMSTKLIKCKPIDDRDLIALGYALQPVPPPPKIQHL